MLRCLLWGAGLLAALAVAGLVLRAYYPKRRASTARSSHVESSADRVEPESEYMGLDVCAECHAAQYRSYQQTAHSRALAEIELSAEPPDGEFDHAKSGRSYRIYRSEGHLRHRECLTSAGDELVSDYPVKYVIGSGRHTRSYLLEDDGFMVESPITRYASRQAWGLSPGYDWPTHWGFERAADLGCVTCHVGRAEPKDDSQNRMIIHELAIGCERCHGPGRGHVNRRKRNSADPPGPNDAIVNPAVLPRQLQEAVCAQCHLRAQATVLLAGRNLNDFRPGQPLAASRIDFRYDGPDGKMTVVGHVEQMRGSRCYQASDRLTCTTCHDPHAPTDAATKVAYYRGKCLQCHGETSCGLPPNQRVARSEGDDCASCHMPQVETNIPHIAFTHHRIGRHETESQPEPSQPLAELTPMGDISWSSEFDRQRTLGLAYLEVADARAEPQAHRFYRQAALDLLTQARTQGIDGGIEAALARIYWEISPQRAPAAALAALDRGDLSPRDRMNALCVLGDTYFQAREWSLARNSLIDLLKLRRHSEDWRLLGICQAELGDLQGAVISLDRALQINPFRPELHKESGRILAAVGQIEAAQRHQELATLLRRQTTGPAAGP